MNAPSSSETQDTHQIPLVDDEVLEILDDFLESDQVDPEALDLYGAHGFLVALAIAPTKTEPGTWISILFNGEPEFKDDATRDEILGYLEQLHNNAVQAFERGLLPELPFDPEVEDELMESPVCLWCAGFMEAVFLDENAWFGTKEEQAAQLLLPFMALSCLFSDEDPDLEALANSPKKATEMANQLPELCLDLYLLYRAPEEKKGPSNAKKGGTRKGTRRGGNR
ncbi:hypothetical protein LMG33818_001206 [Halomonadaceae bacterium LMG 33818]|uniref:YecA/YgfB family protein n=1 Tax=Cernens ardua TaxID=3402176 RepID=UPI003EDCA907